MPELYYEISGITLRSYTLFLTLAAFAGVAGLILRHRLLAIGALVDVGLGALIGALALARLGHVALNWNYFGARADEILRLEGGGMNWHGAVIGGLIGLSLVARWRRFNINELLDSAALVIPLAALAGWYGCLAWACGYGAEVDTLARYPAFAVSEARDVYGILAPRYNTQIWGVILAVALLSLFFALVWRDQLRGLRFWVMLLLLSAGMFMIGFARGDAVIHVAGLRLDQWFDLILFSICAGLIQRKMKHSR
jgi:phosphatidylglycerol:prolipoprotein diacylglycerol transferase